jgi:hypothetical protein
MMSVGMNAFRTQVSKVHADDLSLLRRRVGLCLRGTPIGDLF